MNKPSLLSVRQLRKHFQGRSGLLQRGRRESVKAVDSIGFEIFPSETFAIIGESGCGKTTTLKMVLLLEQPDAGEIVFKGENVLALDTKRRRAYRKAVQAVFQDPYSSLSPRMRVGDIIAEPLRANASISKSAVSDEVARLLALVGLQIEAAARYPHEFSGGQRQRIAIARALSIRPDLIVLDEPVSALDISIRAQIVNLLQDLQQSQGVSFLLVSHDLPIVRHMSHRTAVMYLGKLVEMAPTETLYEQPRHP
jgi:oligopeptide transport system ATP-binding protein